MLNSGKLTKLCEGRNIAVERLAEQLVRGRLNYAKALAAVKNWQKGMYKPIPKSEDIQRLAETLGVNTNDLTEWSASYRYAPISPRKTRLVTELIAGRNVQDAMDILKFTSKRAATMIDKVLRSAVANADEQQANVESLYITEARVDSAGRRIGTKRWIPKDRGRSHPICKPASHIYITVTEE